MKDERIIVIATNNEHKVVELQRLMSKQHIDIALRPLDRTDVVFDETGATFEENAYIKAQTSFHTLGASVIADDSGLEVEALNGAPGIHSARFAGQDATDASNRQRLVAQLSNIGGEQFRAQFRCVLCYVDDHRTLFAEGTCEGVIILSERGTNGFGYDPLFIPDNATSTFAEMSSSQKDQYSHRAQAAHKLTILLAEVYNDTGRLVEIDPIPRTDALVMACIASVTGEEHHLRMAIRLFVRSSTDVESMYEALLQTYLFAGFPVALEALSVFDQEIVALGYHRPVTATPFDVEMFRERGSELCASIYSGVYEKMMDRLSIVSPELSDWMIVEGYGKTLSRPNLGVVDREICIAAVLAVLGRENQLASHVRGAFLVGATTAELTSCAEDVTEWAGNVAGNRLRSAIARFASVVQVLVLTVLALFGTIQSSAQQQAPVKGAEHGSPIDSTRKISRGLAVRQLREDINALISSPEWKGASIGISVLSLDDGEPIILRDADRAFTPASAQKLFTTAVALDQLGPEFTFNTSLYLDGRIRPNGEFVGNIIIRGSGDPTWTEDFGRSASDAIERFVDAIDSLGIRSVRGSLIGDDDVFDDVEYAPGWFWDDLKFAYAPQVSGLGIANNAVQITIVPPTSVSEVASFHVEPQTNFVRVMCALRTVDSTGVTDISPYRDFRSNVIDLSGTVVVRPHGDSTNVYVSVDNPTLFTMSIFRDALVKRGIRFKGTIVDVDDWNTPIVYDSMTAIVVSSSPPLLDMISVINHISHNLGAEVFLKELAYRSTGLGSFSKGAEIIRQWAETNGIAGSQLTIADGSGLSRLNLCTARQLTMLLMAMNRHQYATLFRQSLAAPSERGTLRRRLIGTRAEHAVRAKTGSMNNVSTLAGYLTTREGEQLAFAFMMNGITVPAAMARNLEDLFCMRLTSLARR